MLQIFLSSTYAALLKMHVGVYNLLSKSPKGKKRRVYDNRRMLWTIETRRTYGR